MQIVDVTVPGSELKLAPVGDIQYGSQGCDLKKLMRHIEWGADRGWRFLGMGDYLDHFSPSNLKALKAAQSSLYESANELIDDAVKKRAYELCDILDASWGKWIGMVHGDHAWTLSTGEHIDHLIAEELGAPYLGTSAIVRISLEDSKCDRPLKVFVTHGRGSSVSSTGKTLHLERLLAAFDVDVVLMGHSHLKYGYTVDRLHAVGKGKNARLVHETKVLGITGSFFNGYQLNSRDSFGAPSGGYPEKGAMKPIPTGGILIEAEPVKEDWGWRWDMFVKS